MPKPSGAPDVGDLVMIPSRDANTVRLVIDTRGIELLVIAEGRKDRWVRRDEVRIVNGSR